MNTLHFEAPEGLVLSLRRADGDTALQGEDRHSVQITVDGDLDQCSVEQQNNTLLVDSHAPLSIVLPRDAVVRIEQVSGDLLLRRLDGPVSVGIAYADLSVRDSAGPLSVGQVHGDLTVEDVEGTLSLGEAHGDVQLTRVTSAQLGQVHGDLQVRTVQQALQVGAVVGDVRLREVEGLVTLEEGRGSVYAQNLEGGMELHAVRGDLTLKTALAAGQSYRAKVDGDISARFPPESSARYTLEAGGRLSARLPEVEAREEGRLVGRSGAGEAEVELCAEGDLSLKLGETGEEESHFRGERLAAEIESQVAAHMNEMDLDALVRQQVEKAMRQVEREMGRMQEHIEREAARAEEHARRVQEKTARAEQHARRAHEEAARRAQEHAQRAQERAARAAARAQEKVAHRAQRWHASFGEPSAPFERHTARTPKVSSEEQLAVLRMLQEGKITVEEAEKLLKALER